MADFLSGFGVESETFWYTVIFGTCLGVMTGVACRVIPSLNHWLCKIACMSSEEQQLLISLRDLCHMVNVSCVNTQAQQIIGTERKSSLLKVLLPALRIALACVVCPLPSRVPYAQGCTDTLPPLATLPPIYTPAFYWPFDSLSSTTSLPLRGPANLTQ